jgi:hypothetical protein
MAIADKVQQIVSLAPGIASEVQSLADAQHTTTDQVLSELIETGLEARHYSALVDKLADSSNPEERKQLKEELARLTFGG